MNSNVKKLMMAAAVTGLMGGATARLQAAPATDNAKSTVKVATKAGKVAIASATSFDADKHSCKGKNDCKGQGGCKASDNGCKGKNSCKGKGGCATDGSKA
jgi:hypothetical protein